MSVVARKLPAKSFLSVRGARTTGAGAAQQNELRRSIAEISARIL
jgi:hypothetical protein